MRLLLLAFGSLLTVACGGAPPAPDAGSGRRPGSEVETKTKGGVPALRATEIAKVPAGTFGPYVGQTSDGALIVWAPLEGERRAWYALGVSLDGTPRGEPRRVADAPSEIGVVAVRGLASGSIAVVSTKHVGLGDAIELTLLRANGELLAAPRVIAETASPALWVEASDAKAGAFVLWATKSAAAAEVRGVVAGRGTAGEPKTLASGVSAWQAVPFAGGTALAVVRSKPAPAGGGNVELALFDAEGRARGEPVVASSKGRPALDVDLAALGENLIVAWSDAREGENRIYRAILDATLRVRVPEGPLTTPLGEQALVRVLARRGATRAFVVWENPGARRGELRAFDLASLGPDGRVSAERARLVLESDDALPELAAVGDGVAALTLAPVCPQKSESCGDELLPTFVRFSQDLSIVASEPLRLEPLAGGAAELGWGLTCGDEACFSLAALGQAPAPVWVTRLERRSAHFMPAGERLGAEQRPSFRENRVLAETDALAGVGFRRGEAGALLAHLSDFDPTTPWVRLKKPAPDGRFDPLRAKLVLAPLDANGSELAPPQDLSLRAHSLGGVALLPGASNADHLIAWAGVDAGQPQVFLTLVGANGARKSQRMLTRKPGDKSDIAAAQVGNGWVVAWVDERDQDSEVYATRVDATLGRIGGEQRLSRAPGPATQPSVAPAGDKTLIAWADARQPELPGEADIYLGQVSTRDAVPAGSERLVVATRGHSFAPQLRRRGDAFALAWLERGAADSDAAGAVMVQGLDASGTLAGEALRVDIAGDPAAVALECAAEHCRVVVSTRIEDGAELYGGTWRPGSSLELARLTRLGSKRAAGAALALAGEELVFADADGEGRWRVRRALVDW